MQQYPPPDIHRALAIIAAITTQAELWRLVDRWRHARRRLSREDNRALSAALASAFERITGTPFRPQSSPKPAVPATQTRLAL